MYGSNWQNEAGEPYMTASQLAFEAALDEQSAMEQWEDRFYDEAPPEDEDCERCGSDEHPTDECDEEEEEDYDLSGSHDDAVGPDEMEDAWLDGSYEE